VQSYPYSETFENNNGGFSVNGAAPSWEWGLPNKPVINQAASGQNCWVTGGLNNGFYNNGEASWLQSPCFDFTNLQFPYLSFDCWWETENTYDGLALQYSIDNGATWTNLSDVLTCLDSNWYNQSSVRFLSSFGASSGWSGNIQPSNGSCAGGGGSGKWLKVKKTMPSLANRPNVIFRFVFGAGTQCNAFDGIAIDNIYIDEAPSNVGNIGFICSGNTVVFNFNTTLCPSAYQWNFDDPLSGNDNTAVSDEVQHTFQQPGHYRVSVTVTGPANASFTTYQDIHILGVDKSITQPLLCTGTGTATALATVSGSLQPISILWNTAPPQFGSIATNLIEGTYVVNFSASDACPNEDSIQIKKPTVQVSENITQPNCIIANGFIALNVSGNYPYRYLWQPAVSSDSIANNLLPGNYLVTITDFKNCITTKNITIQSVSKPVIFLKNIHPANCNGLELGSARVEGLDGKQPYSWKWNVGVNNVSDSIDQLLPGKYVVTLTDANFCLASDTIQIEGKGICDGIYFPDAFSPNADGKNETFGPLGNLIALKNYKLIIYNRFGQIVFESNAPSQKWDGKYKGFLQPTGNYIWLIKYVYNDSPLRSLKGNILLLR
jgi:gliding motility-associated-like protein